MLTNSKYHSLEMNKKYFSVSQYKDFLQCEAMAMAKINGTYKTQTTTAFLVGSYVDAYFEGTLEELKKEYYSAIYTKQNTLRADFKKAEEIIARVEKDPLFMKFMSGEKQKIFTAEMFGVPWKIKIDSYHEGICIVDLKVVRNLKTLPIWRYDIQGAVYQEVTYLNTGKRLPFYLAPVTKEDVIDLDIFQIMQEDLDFALAEVEVNISRYAAIKAGEIEPHSCGECDYCKSVKSARIRNYNELREG
jgi:hypothetical protein